VSKSPGTVLSSQNSWDMTSHLISSSAFLAGSDGAPLPGLVADVEQPGIGGLLLGKGLSLVPNSGDIAITGGDAKEASKRESKRKQVLSAKDKDKEYSTVSATKLQFCATVCTLTGFAHL
jgi:hypothetical protein